MKARLGTVLLALLLLGLTPALANVVDRGEIQADCYGFTLTFYTSSFDSTNPNEQISIDWQVYWTRGGVLEHLSGNTIIKANGAFSEMHYFNPDHSLVCAPIKLILSDQDGQPSWGRFDWTGTSGSGAQLFQLPVGALQEFDCTCPPHEISGQCRTPGFWGTHAGQEKSASKNITQAVLSAYAAAHGDAFPTVCGIVVKNTDLAKVNSAEEALCVSVQGDQRLQLARQLTAAVLNCIMSGGGATCSGMGAIEQNVLDCDHACTGQLSGAYGQCIDLIDCFNNGGTWNATVNMCQIGTCGGLGATPCSRNDDCLPDDLGNPVLCVPTPGNCHDQPLQNEELGLDFTTPGPAGSSRKCNDAVVSSCTLIGC